LPHLFWRGPFAEQWSDVAEEIQRREAAAQREADTIKRAGPPVPYLPDTSERSELSSAGRRKFGQIFWFRPSGILSGISKSGDPIRPVMPKCRRTTPTGSDSSLVRRRQAFKAIAITATPAGLPALLRQTSRHDRNWNMPRRGTIGWFEKAGSKNTGAARILSLCS
jgi:hypothetical protein